MQFLKELKTECYNMVSHIHNHCGAILQVPEVDLMNTEVWKTKFCNQIGWIHNNTGGGSYSAVDIEILHKDYSGEYSLSSIFLNPIFMGVSIDLFHWHLWYSSFYWLALYRTHLWPKGWEELCCWCLVVLDTQDGNVSLASDFREWGKFSAICNIIMSFYSILTTISGARSSRKYNCASIRVKMIKLMRIVIISYADIEKQ